MQKYYQKKTLNIYEDIGKPIDILSVDSCDKDRHLSPTLLPCSAIVPTRNRTDSLARMLISLAQQSSQPTEMIIVDASIDDKTEDLCKVNPDGLLTQIIYKRAILAGAAAQRNQAISHASQDTILFMDDDIFFEPNCISRLWDALQSSSEFGGVNAMITNQQYFSPGRISQLLFRFLHGRKENSYAGLCIGPGLNLLPEDRPDLPEIVPIEWLNAGCTLYRRSVLPNPPFPPIFTGYSLMEDAALSLLVGKKWKLANARTARIFHDSQPGDHKSNVLLLSKMELVNRHFVMTKILGRNQWQDYLKLIVLQTFQIVSAASSLQQFGSLPAILYGKMLALFTILWGQGKIYEHTQ